MNNILIVYKGRYVLFGRFLSIRISYSTITQSHQLIVSDPGIEPKVLELTMNWEPLNVDIGYDIVYLSSTIKKGNDGKEIGSISSRGDKAASFPTQNRRQRPALFKSYQMFLSHVKNTV